MTAETSIKKKCYCGLFFRKHPKCPVCRALIGSKHDSQLQTYRDGRVCQACVGRWKVMEQKEKSTVTFEEFKRGMLMPQVKENEKLSERQLEYLRLVYRGYSNKQIAWELKVTEQSVKNTVVLIFLKLDASSRSEAVYKAIQQGLIDVEILSEISEGKQ